MKNYSRTKGKSHLTAYRTPSCVRVQKTLIAKLRERPLPQPKTPYGK